MPFVSYITSDEPGFNPMKTRIRLSAKASSSGVGTCEYTDGGA